MLSIYLTQLKLIVHIIVLKELCNVRIRNTTMSNVKNAREWEKSYSMREKGGQVSAGCRHRECWLRQNSVMIFSSEIMPADVRASSAGAEA